MSLSVPKIMAAGRQKMTGKVYSVTSRHRLDAFDEAWSQANDRKLIKLKFHVHNNNILALFELAYDSLTRITRLIEYIEKAYCRPGFAVAFWL